MLCSCQTVIRQSSGSHFEFSKSAIFFCTMDGFSRILEKKLPELLCTRLYIVNWRISGPHYWIGSSNIPLAMICQVFLNWLQHEKYFEISPSLTCQNVNYNFHNIIFINFFSLTNLTSLISSPTFLSCLVNFQSCSQPLCVESKFDANDLFYYA
jgi:hypothetical protein